MTSVNVDVMQNKIIEDLKKRLASARAAEFDVRDAYHRVRDAYNDAGSRLVMARNEVSLVEGQLMSAVMDEHNATIQQHANRSADGKFGGGL